MQLYAWKLKSAASCLNDSSAIGTIVTANAYTGRFAPSPTGPLHLGSLLAALISFLDARHHQGRWLLRIEDIDPPREVPGAAESILSSLEAHGLHWDGPVRFQSDSHALHRAAVDTLISKGDTFFCRCARKRLIEDGHSQRYPGFCRDAGHKDGALRVRVTDSPIKVHDRWQAATVAQLEQSPGDFIVVRRDTLIAYQLAVVVDDADQGVTDVVRGFDLYASTPRQIWLQQRLGLPTPRYAHFPVLLNPDGEKLSKQAGAPPIDDQTPAANLAKCLTLAGIGSPETPPRGSVKEALAFAQTHYDPQKFTGINALTAVHKNS